MPATSERQRRFFGAELSRLRKGERTETDMSESQLRASKTRNKKTGSKPGSRKATVRRT